MWCILGHSTQQTAYALPNVDLWMIETGKELGDDPWENHIIKIQTQRAVLVFCNVLDNAESFTSTTHNTKDVKFGKTDVTKDIQCYVKKNMHLMQSTSHVRGLKVFGQLPCSKRAKCDIFPLNRCKAQN